jgi:metallophosphoesterase (TIGR00282 family)
MRILFFGDVFGKSGRLALLENLESLKEEFQPDFTVINGENLADGRGLTEKTAKPLLKAGVDCITGGNHLWDRAEALDFIRSQPEIVKPLNYPATAAGNACHTIERDGMSLSVICITGQVFMPPCDSPFNTFDAWLANHATPPTHILLDFHSESTAEKRAMGWHTDGRISALVGTHTHIQTADEEILPQGTAFITDVGMTGPHDSVIGIKKGIILEKFRHAMPIRYEVSAFGLQINAVVIDLDPVSGRALSITRIRRKVVLPE